MAVIVKGMEMPKHCYECPLQDREYGVCNILKITVYDIPKECPLVEVVQCKDCKYLVRSEGVCKVLSNNYEPPVYVEDDDFCSRGKRREDGKD